MTPKEKGIIRRNILKLRYYGIDDIIIPLEDYKSTDDLIEIAESAVLRIDSKSQSNKKTNDCKSSQRS